MSAFRCVTEVRVRLPETDAFGVAYHGSYFTWFDVARMDYLRAIGLMDVVKSGRAGNLIVHTSADFKAPARFDGVAEVPLGAVVGPQGGGDAPLGGPGVGLLERSLGDDHHPPVPGGGEGRGEAGHTGTHHEHVREHLGLVPSVEGDEGAGRCGRVLQGGLQGG